MFDNLSKIILTVFFFSGAAFLTAQEAVFTDDFQSNENGWYESKHVKIIDGQYEFNNQEFGEFSWMNDTMQDGSIEADSTWLGGHESRGYGLIFRLLDVKNFYVLWITAEGNYSVGKIVDDNAVPIKGWTYSEAIRKRGKNRIRIEFCGSLMNIFINGEKLSVLKDDTFTQGGYGFYTHGGVHAVYDNLEVVSGSPFTLHMPSNGSMDRFRDMTGKTFS